jgi:hypothetical protein
MWITLLGSVGIGLVFGWLIGRFDGSPHRKLINTLAVNAATLSIAGLVFWFAGWPGTLFFLAGAILAFLLRLGWQRQLRRRFRLFT